MNKRTNPNEKNSTPFSIHASLGQCNPGAGGHDERRDDPVENEGEEEVQVDLARLEQDRHCLPLDFAHCRPNHDKEANE